MRNHNLSLLSNECFSSQDNVFWILSGELSFCNDWNYN